MTLRLYKLHYGLYRLYINEKFSTIHIYYSTCKHILDIFKVGTYSVSLKLCSTFFSTHIRSPLVLVDTRLSGPNSILSGSQDEWIRASQEVIPLYLQKRVCTKVHIEEKKCSYIATINLYLYLIYYKAPLVVTKSSLILDLALN